MQYSKEQTQKKEKRDQFNAELNMHLDAINRLAGSHWEFVLTYIKSQATLKKVDPFNSDDYQLAREYCMKSEINRIYKRLAQLEGE